MNTNDPQAPYTVKLNGPIEAATAPLLSDTKALLYKIEFMGLAPATQDVRKARAEVDAIEAKIASGELIVSKPVDVLK